jgi:hypothetical protein
LRAPRLVAVERPEARGVRCQHLVGEHDPIIPVPPELEFRIGEQDAIALCVLDRYQPGGPQPSFDKQYVRDWLDASGWDHTPPAPELPPEVVADTRDKYVEAYEYLVGESFERWSRRD